MKAYLIKSTDQTIVEVDCHGLADLQRMVGGYIEAAKYWDSGDVLFVDEEFLLKGGNTWFQIEGNARPLGGSGVVVGPEKQDNATAPTFTLAALQAEVVFLSDTEVRAWAAAHRNEPMVAIHVPGEPPNIISTIGDLYGPDVKDDD